MRRSLATLATLALGAGLALLPGAAAAMPAAPAGTDPPLCRLVSLVVQTSGGGQAPAWFHWCGDQPDAPGPLRWWVVQLTGDGFTMDPSQCPRANPCTIFGSRQP